jgi:hypothetical protein
MSLAATTGEAALLTGEELAFAPAHFDAGWIAGELHELHAHFLRDDAAHRAHACHALITALTGSAATVYGAAPIQRVATLRTLTHLHDFAAYVGWHDSLLEYVSDLGDRIDATETLGEGAGRR